MRAPQARCGQDRSIWIQASRSVASRSAQTVGPLVNGSGRFRHRICLAVLPAFGEIEEAYGEDQGKTHEQDDQTSAAQA
ncbi:MAG: hypothetical protein ABW039_01000 [Sphingobium sp.]